MSHLAILRSPLLAEVAGVRHAFFGRRGGASSGIYDSLNVGLGSKDDPAAVQANRARAAAALGVEADALLTAYQIHSARAVEADGPWESRPEADAVVTTAANLACGALSADCAPVLLADGRAGVVAAAHAGWRGALDGVVEAAVQLMQDKGAQRSNIVAAVGPCIAQASYEVGMEFVERFTGQAPGSETFFGQGRTADKRQFDLPGFVLHRLAQAGVQKAEWIGRDTCAEESMFFSNRRAVLRGEPDYGRLLSAITLI
ncbi:MAG TPA: peptidoglycan editing factor PgeF [Caulobacteraceae bacterium]|nr:peptidoglycan editing factor PgeF [Caulobacteraceae bacterium]